MNGIHLQSEFQTSHQILTDLTTIIMLAKLDNDDECRLP
jgi:hypothetical protein